MAPSKRRKKTDTVKEKDQKEVPEKKITEKREEVRKCKDVEKYESEKPDSKLLSKMKSILDSVQKGYSHQAKNIEKMWELKESYKDSNEEFFENFWYCLQHSCLVLARELPTERIIQFCCQFAIRADLTREEFADEEVSQTGPFAVRLFHTALKYHDAHNKAVRFRLCQIVNMMLTALGADAEIDEELYDKIYTCMLERLQDKVPAVRVQGVSTLNRLQDPSDPECPVMKGYLNIMKTDAVAEVRRSAVKAIAVNTKSMLPIIERTRDTNPTVRRAAYEVLIEKISIRAMKISYRMKLLESGMRDRSPGVKHACILLIKKWVSYYENDIIKLLKALDVEEKVDLCVEIVDEILKEVHIDTAVGCLISVMVDNVIPIDQLSCENVFYWRCLVNHCSTAFPHIYEKIMPTLSDFSKYIKDYVVMASTISPEDYDEHYQASYIVQELIKMAKLADMADEAGRKNLIEVAKYIITEAEITVQSIERLVELYCVAEVNEQDRIKTMAGIINDVRNPLEGATQFNLEEIVSCEKNDPLTMIRCLTMMSGLVKCVKCDVAFDPTLSVLLQDIVLTGVISNNEIVRHLSIKALGFSCILSKTLAKKYLVFFQQVVMVDNFADILETSLNVIFDLFLVFGIETFAEDDPIKITKNESVDLMEHSDHTLLADSQEDIITSRMENVSVSDTASDTDAVGDPENPIKDIINQDTETFSDLIIAKFKDFLDDEVLRSVAAEGIAKLMYNGRLVDAQLFSRLLLLWYSPTTEGDPLRHCLGMFFSTFGAKNEDMLDVVEQAFFPTLETICDAPHTSPLLEINPLNVAELMLSLLRGRHHEQIAIKICNEILVRPSSSYGMCLIKALPRCGILGGDQTNLKLIHCLILQIIEEVDHVTTKKSLTTHALRIESFINVPEKEDEDKENIDSTVSKEQDVSTQESDKTVKRRALYFSPSRPVDILDTID